MDDNVIRKIMEKVLQMNNNPKIIDEFLCGCKNAISIIENKQAQQQMKTIKEIQFKSLMESMNKWVNGDPK